MKKDKIKQEITKIIDSLHPSRNNLFAFSILLIASTAASYALTKYEIIVSSEFKWSLGVPLGFATKIQPLCESGVNCTAELNLTWTNLGIDAIFWYIIASMTILIWKRWRT